MYSPSFEIFPQIRTNTLKEGIVKHAFKTTRIWPDSFKAVQKKLKEYSKEKRRDIGLEL